MQPHRWQPTRLPCPLGFSRQEHWSGLPLPSPSILKEISPGISLGGMMLKLKLQYFGHLMQRVDSLDKTLMLGGIGCRRRRGWQRMRWLDGMQRLLSPQKRVQAMGGSTETEHVRGCIGEGNGKPLQCSCLENPRGRGSLVGCRLWGRSQLADRG